MEGPASSGPRPMVLTDDQDLLDQMLRLCAAAGVTPDVLADVSRAREPWPRASLVMVGDDVAAAVSRLRLPRRDNVVLVSQARESSPLWRVAVDIRADEVAILPAAQSWLIGRLSDLADGTSHAVTVAVIGGCGGAGASTFAAALSLTAAKQGLRALLVDADPLGGGVELAVGCEGRQGLRWPEVAATRGRVSAAAFRAALPAVGGLAVLSWDRAELVEPDRETMSAMVSAAQRGSQIVVIDLPRRLDEAAADALLRSDLLIVVTRAEVRAVASAAMVLPRLRRLCGDIRVVVRKVSRSGITTGAVVDALGLPFAGSLPSRRSVARAVDEGFGPLGRGPLERACRPILRSVVESRVSSR